MSVHSERIVDMVDSCWRRAQRGAGIGMEVTA